ncbi:hypothetical protein GCM10022212_18320 [Actimicrobium antarcticum]|uniref:Uncharacterized protein n=2 Tax=Actimicrobium antarcticum TaxID=1051899 RepID=A0ABP7T6B6_9BURK
MYHIFDIKTAASTSSVSKAAVDGLGKNTNQINQNTPLQMSTALPATPGRFTISDMSDKLGGTGLGVMLQMSAMQGGGISMKAASCNGAVWTARAERTISGSSNLTLYGCLYRYQSGYHLDTYAIFQKVEGGILQVSRDIANSMIGTPEEWVDKTIMDMVRTIEAIPNTKVTHIEGQPEIGNGPAIARLTNK